MKFVYLTIMYHRIKCDIANEIVVHFMLSYFLFMHMNVLDMLLKWMYHSYSCRFAFFLHKFRLVFKLEVECPE